MNTRILPTLILAGLATVAQTGGQTDLNGTQSVLDQWVQTRQLISKEKSDWRTEKAILEDTRTLLTNERERLAKALEDLDASATAVDEEREQLQGEKERLGAAAEVVTDDLGGLETRLKAIVATLPEPLLNKIKPLVTRLPDDPSQTDLSLGERVQNIVGILSQTDKFNTTITLSSESQKVGDGNLIQVSTLYWGLAIAYFVDDSGGYAGIGVPAEGGWEWSEIKEAGSAIRRLLDVYEGTVDIQFVEVPARIN